MTKIQPESTELESQYAAQLTTDLERNTQEQERISAEVAALEGQLRHLQRDQTLLASLRQALGESPAVSQSSSKAAPAARSVPRQASSKPTPAKPRKTATAKPKKAVGKKTATNAGKTTLVELIRDCLAQQTEPRSAAEINSALAQAHPDREIKPKVVRVTVEGLVAKGHAHRTKQGSSVFYTAATPVQAEEAAG